MRLPTSARLDSNTRGYDFGVLLAAEGDFPGSIKRDTK